MPLTCLCGDCGTCREEAARRPSLLHRIRRRVVPRYRKPWIVWRVSHDLDIGWRDMDTRRNARRRRREMKAMARSLGVPIKVDIRPVDITKEPRPWEGETA